MQTPNTKAGDVIDEIHGVVVPDPYRWLEDGADEEVKKWVAEQNRHTKVVLGGECQKEFADELAKDFSAIEFSNPLPVNSRYFFLERQPDEDQQILYMKVILKGLCLSMCVIFSKMEV